MLLSLASCFDAREEKVYKKIAVIYSYSQSDRIHASIDELVPDIFSANGIDADIESLYLPTITSPASSLQMIKEFVDTVYGGKFDALMIYGDRALNHYIANPDICKNKPVVFGGVNFPNYVSMGKLDDLYGCVDAPDYVENVRFVNKIRGVTKLAVLVSNVDDKHFGIQELVSQCRRSNINVEQIFSQDSLPLTFEQYMTQSAELNKKANSYSFVRMIPFDNVEGLALIKVLRNSATFDNLAILQLDDDISPYIFLSLSHIPIFNVLHYGFHNNEKMFGGYFASKQTIANDWVGLTSSILKGEKPKVRFRESEKHYFLDYDLIDRLSVDESVIPSNVVMVGQSWAERHATLYSFIRIFLALLIITLVVLSIRSRLNIYKVKKLNRSIEQQHQFLLNSISGSDAICGKVQNGYIYLTAKYTNTDVGKVKPKMSLEEFLQFVHPDDRERFIANFSVLSERTQFSSQYRCGIHLDGNYEWYEVIYRVIKNKSGAWVAAGVFHNIQNIKDEEEQLVRNREIIEKTELKQAFLENMTHEIRSPLNSIVGFSNLLSSPDASMLSKEDKQNFKALMGENINNLLAILDEILEMSHLQSGEMAFNIKSYPVNKLTKDVYLSFHVIVKPNVELLYEESDTDMYVQVDKLRITQVLMNFLTNSNKFTDSGHIKIGSRYDSDNSEARIYVEDTGKGVDSKKLKNIFDRFAKADEKDRGTGIGLSLCSMIAERLNGRIEVDSKPGKGSVFTIVLPCRIG